LVKTLVDGLELIGITDDRGRLVFVGDISGDSLSTTINTLAARAYQHLFNGTNWDRERGNTAITILASGARTTPGASSDQTNHNARGIILIVNVTAVSGTAPTLDVDVEAKDPVSGNYVVIASMTQITTTGTYIIVLYPGAIDDQAKVDNQGLPLPRTWRVAYAIGGTTPSFTFSVGGMYIV